MKKVIIVDIIDPNTSPKEAKNRIIESENLVNTYWWVVIFKKYQKRQSPDYRYFIWKWKIEEIKKEALDNWIDFIIINNQLKPQQLFNIEWDFFKTEKIKIWDRIDLILKIFEKHASSSEAKLQIELAAIKHMWPRIFGMWMELSRQWGWSKLARWKWETNTEIMKRHLSKQEKVLREKISKLEKRRESQRISRERKWLKSVAIVGYTNAGKSQLMNAVSKKKVKAKNELFATLDTRTWELYLSWKMKTCLISDTIWFIRDLPPELIEAFKSTLEEAIHADLILHVIDFSDPERLKKMAVTNKILKELWADEIPKIIVANKIDLTECKIEDVKWNNNSELQKVFKPKNTKTFEDKYKNYPIVYVSALNRLWLERLIIKIEENLNWYAE